MQMHPLCTQLLKFPEISWNVEKLKDATPTPKNTNDNKKLVGLLTACSLKITNLHLDENAMRKMGWMMGVEPTTTGTTIRGSTNWATSTMLLFEDVQGIEFRAECQLSGNDRAFVGWGYVCRLADCEELLDCDCCQIWVGFRLVLSAVFCVCILG